MKTQITRPLPRLHFLWLAVLFSIVTLVGVTGARAGLTMTVQITRSNNQGSQGYVFGAYLQTNNTPPNISFGDYLVASPGYPANANAAWTLCHFDTNGFSDVAGYNSQFSDFDAPDMADSMIQSMTNGAWSIYVTNSTTTNIYYFTVSATIGSNDVPLVEFTYPTNGAVGVPNQPTLTWEDPTNYSQMFLGGPNPAEQNSGQFLPPTQTSISGLTLNDGLNQFTLDTYYYATNGVVSSVPVDTNSNPISSWVSNWSVYDYATIQFMVGPPVDTTGTAHTLVAHYTWDATNADGSASGADSSGNGYNMNFSGSFGSQGGVNWTKNAIVGPGALQFADGDDYSGGYVGWSETPTNLLATIAGSFSISCWVNTTQAVEYAGAPASSGVGIVSAYTGGLANDVIPLELIGGQPAFNTGGNEDDTLTSNGSVNDGNNHLVVVTRNQLTGQKIIYIDGVLDQYGFGTTNLLTDAQLLTIGSLADATDPYATDAYYYNGYAGVLDDLQIYSGVLSSNEVAALYASPGITLPNFGADTLTVTASPLSGTAPLTVQFTSPGVDSDGNAVTNWVWTFGDGGTSTNESPTYTYYTRGTYTPTLVAQSTGGAFPTVSGPGVITVSDVQVSVTASPRAGPAPLTVQFTGPDMDIEGNTVTSWAWTFGDGGTSTNQSPLHTYVNLGNYSPSVVVQGSGGYIPVVGGPGTVVVSASDGATLAVTASPLSGQSPLTVYFSSPNTDSLGNTITNWLWVFGDGATSTEENPYHTYYSLGTYTPSLVAQSAGGLFSAVTGLGVVTVTTPQVTVAASPQSGPEPLTVQFTSPSVDGDFNLITNWFWNFGDGTTSTEQHPVHTYTNVGSYLPSLVVQGSAGYVPTVIGPGAVFVTLSPTAFQTSLPGSPSSFTYDNFANAGSIQANGGAATATTSDGPVLELTGTGATQSGSAFSANALAFTHNLGFSTFFEFRLAPPASGSSGDAVTFALQTDTPFNLGGGGSGARGITNSVSVEFDAFTEGTQSVTPNGINANQVAVWNNGTGSLLAAAPVAEPLNNGNLWYAWVDYEGISQDLEVRLSEVPVRPLAPTLDMTINLPNILQTTNVITSGTLSTTNLVVNGDFENEPNWAGGVSYDGWETALVTNQLPGWTCVPGHAVTIHKAGGPYLTISGEYSANTDGEGYDGNNADFYQDFASSANSVYTLNFDWQSWGYGVRPDYSCLLQVSLQDIVTDNVLFNGSYYFDGPYGPLHKVTAMVPGTGDPIRLRIAQDPPSGYNDNLYVVDNFSVTGAPGYAKAYVGFTGNGQNQQDILAWKFLPLPTTTITGVFTLTNLPPGFQFNSALALQRYVYKVGNNVYTNYSYVPLTITPGTNSKYDAVSGLDQLDPDAIDMNVEANASAIEGALQENAAALDATNWMQFSMLAAYDTGSGTQGAAINYDTADYIPSTAYYADNSFNNLFNMNETTYTTLIDQVAANPPPGLFPPSLLTQLQLDQNTFTGANNGQWLSMGAGGVIDGDTILYSQGTVVGSLSVRQQVVDSPPKQLVILTPHSDGTNFLFDFATVQNESYTVWVNTSLATTNWISCTNFTSDGYVQEMAIPLTNAMQSFFQLSSP